MQFNYYVPIMIQIKKISAEETYAIRLEVLRKNIPLPYKMKGDFSITTFHLGAFKNGALIAVSSYMHVVNSSFKGNQYQLRGMATLKEYQGCGVGKQMLQEAFFILKEKQVNYLWCNARVNTVEFYKKQGLQIQGNLFTIPLVGAHYKMFVRL